METRVIVFAIHKKIGAYDSRVTLPVQLVYFSKCDLPCDSIK